MKYLSCNRCTENPAPENMHWEISAEQFVPENMYRLNCTATSVITGSIRTSTHVPKSLHWNNTRTSVQGDLYWQVCARTPIQGNIHRKIRTETSVPKHLCRVSTVNPRSYIGRSAPEKQYMELCIYSCANEQLSKDTRNKCYVQESRCQKYLHRKVS